MKKRIVKYFIIFLKGVVVTFVFVLLCGRFLGFYGAKDPTPLSWDELFSDYLNVILLIPAIIGLIAIYIKWDNDKHPE